MCGIQSAMPTDTLALIGLLVVSSIGVLLVLFQLPGNWLIVAAVAAYGWITDWQYLGPWTLLWIALMALAGEIVETVMSLWTAGKAGASRRAMWAGLLGGILGAFIFSVPVPIIGTILGAALGCFTGAVIAEMTVHDNLERASRIGVAAAIGRMLGSLFKLAMSIGMIMTATLSVIL